MQLLLELKRIEEEKKRSTTRQDLNPRLKIGRLGISLTSGLWCLKFSPPEPGNEPWIFSTVQWSWPISYRCSFFKLSRWKKSLSLQSSGTVFSTINNFKYFNCFGNSLKFNWSEQEFCTRVMSNFFDVNGNPFFISFWKIPAVIRIQLSG